MRGFSEELTLNMPKFGSQVIGNVIIRYEFCIIQA
jgi:hypothetical protein